MTTPDLLRECREVLALTHIYSCACYGRRNFHGGTWECKHCKGTGDSSTTILHIAGCHVDRAAALLTRIDAELAAEADMSTNKAHGPLGLDGLRERLDAEKPDVYKMGRSQPWAKAPIGTTPTAKVPGGGVEWTTEPPTESGYYFVAKEFNGQVKVLVVSIGEGSHRVQYDGYLCRSVTRIEEPPPPQRGAKGGDTETQTRITANVCERNIRAVQAKGAGE